MRRQQGVGKRVGWQVFSCMLILRHKGNKKIFLLTPHCSLRLRCTTDARAVRPYCTHLIATVGKTKITCFCTHLFATFNDSTITRFHDSTKLLTPNSSLFSLPLQIRESICKLLHNYTIIRKNMNKSAINSA